MIKLTKLTLILNNGWKKLPFFRELLKYKRKSINYNQLVITYDGISIIVSFNEFY
jgi:hypothetical protein